MEGFEVTSHCSPNSQQHLGCERLGYRIRQSAHCLLLIQQHLDMWNIKTKTKNEVLLNGNTKCLSTHTRGFTHKHTLVLVRHYWEGIAHYTCRVTLSSHINYRNPAQNRSLLSVSARKSNWAKAQCLIEISFHMPLNTLHQWMFNNYVFPFFHLGISLLFSSQTHDISECLSLLCLYSSPKMPSHGHLDFFSSSAHWSLSLFQVELFIN